MKFTMRTSGALIGLGLLIVGPASAQQVWTYKSKSLKGIKTDTTVQNQVSVAPQSDIATVTLTLEQPLGASLVNSVVPVANFQVACADCYDFMLFPNNPSTITGSGLATLIVSTDSRGQIIDWYFSLRTAYEVAGIQVGTESFESATVDVLSIASGAETSGDDFYAALGGARGTWTSPSFANQVKVLECPGNNVYATILPSNTAIVAVSPNANGQPVSCAKPSSEPATWYIKTTTNDGDTWQWGLYTLGDLGLGN